MMLRRGSRCVINSALIVMLAMSLIVAGCSSASQHANSLLAMLPSGIRPHLLTREVKSLLDQRQYQAARKKLDDAQAGEVMAPDALRDEDRVGARRLFQDRIEQDFLTSSKQLSNDGKPRGALGRLDEGLGLCSWCDGLKARRHEVRRLVAELDRIGQDLASVVSGRWRGVDDLPAYRNVLSSVTARRSDLRDSPRIASDSSLLEARIAQVWARTLSSQRVSEDEQRQIRADMDLLGAARDDQERVSTQIGLVRVLVDQGTRPVRAEDFQRALVESLRSGETDRNPRSLTPVRAAAREYLVTRVVEALRVEARESDVTYALLAFEEELLRLVPEQHPVLAGIVARGHALRAQQLAGSGRAAVLALLHIDRMKGLGFAPSDVDARRLKEVAEASYAGAGRLAIRVRIETNPADEPVLQDLVRIAIKEAVRRRARSHVRVKVVDVAGPAPDVEVAIRSIRMLVPSSADLTSIHSTYLSHFEDAPNPVKQVVRSQLASQKLTVDLALSSLNSAISSFNIYPTEYGLLAVNSARRRYRMEVDSYNDLVRQFNTTPATISRPVYLPYTFREGTVRHGWSVTVVVTTRAGERQFTVEEADSDFVRVGTRTDDRDVRYRRDERLDIPVGTERLVAQLVKVADRVTEHLSQPREVLRVEVRAQLSPPEQGLLDTMLHPFLGSERTDGVNGAEWAKGSLRKVALPSLVEGPVPATRLSVPPHHTSGGTPEQVASFYGSCVALIFGGKGAVGSGALVSPDGLVLTAAHVLLADSVEVAFPAAASRERRYKGEVVFVNDAHDVALIRVPGYRSDRWLEVATAEAVQQGEAVFAMGNPAIREAGTAVTAVSKGIIAKAYEAESQGRLRGLVADITVASGSSGGPLISQRSGKVVGVVTAVVAPTISKDFATSGYWAVAAPSTELRKWLGITYTD